MEDKDKVVREVLKLLKEGENEALIRFFESYDSESTDDIIDALIDLERGDLMGLSRTEILQKMKEISRRKYS